MKQIEVKRLRFIGVFAGLLCVFLGGGNRLSAREERTPLLQSIRGYDFDPKENYEGFRAQFSSHMYYREADRAFQSNKLTSHTDQYSALIFNKDDFRMSQAFQDCKVLINSRYYNPYMRVMRMQPKVGYSERGVNLGFSIDREVYQDKSRAGIRVNVPFRSVQMTRRDSEGRRDSQTEDVVKFQGQEAQVLDSSGNPTGDIALFNGYAYRLDFLEAMPKSAVGESAVNYTDTTSKGIKILEGATHINTAGNKIYGAALHSPEGITPKGDNIGMLETNVSKAATLLPNTLDSLEEDVLYNLGNQGSPTDYSGLDSSSMTVDKRVEMQDKKATVWIASTYNPETGKANSEASQKLSSTMPDLIKTYNANTYEWLHDKGYHFATHRAQGLGDIDLEAYYEHSFRDKIFVEGTVGVKIPGSQDTDYYSNPYRAHVGNGHHYEVKLGARALYEARHNLAISLKGSYSQVLSGLEQRTAVLKGSRVKNIGQRADADVSWGYFVGDLDVHMAHLRTSDVTVMLGYQIYYKRADKVTFKKATLNGWMGRLYNPGSTNYDIANTTTLDNTLAAVNTERFAHKLKYMMTYHASDWFGLSFGGSYALVGKNAPRELDMYLGWHMNF